MTTGLRVTPIYRAPDWPLALHRAVDRWEAAMQRVCDARNEEELTVAVAARDEAHRAAGYQMLALDKQRRPHIYR